MHNRQALTPSLVWKAVTDYHVWPLYFISLTFNLPTVPVSNYLQISFRRFGFSRPMTNLLAVPNTVFSIINIVIITLVSEAVNNRSFVCMTQTVVSTTGPVSGQSLTIPVAIPLLGRPRHGQELHQLGVLWYRYCFPQLSLGPCDPGIMGIYHLGNSRDENSRFSVSLQISIMQAGRMLISSLYNMSIQLSSIIGANVYQPSDAPRYYTANKAMLAVVVFNMVVVYPGTWYFFGRVNKKRERVWSAMSSDEKSEYLRTTKDEGNKRLDFRFAR